MQQVIITHKIADELTKALVSGNYDKVFTFTDKTPASIVCQSSTAAKQHATPTTSQ